jgi:predicted DNA-binding ribbon-helix-helix protein
MQSSVVKKRSIMIAKHKTSVSLEAQFWESLKEIAKERNETVSELIAGIDAHRSFSNLSSAIRLFVLDCYRNRQNEMISSPALSPNSIGESTLVRA